jgi:pimeloyl-ACP methyl ester carboxylesterase
MPLRCLPLFFLLLLLSSGPAPGQNDPLGAAPPKSYPVGFRVIKTYDASRPFDTTRLDSLRFRPVKLDLFYPAVQTGGATPLPYGYFLDLYGHRIDFANPPDSCRKEGEQLGAYFESGLGLPPGALRRLPTRSYPSVPQAPGPFPVVLYLPGYNGMSYENLPLLERLAARGYLVVAVSSVGKYPGYMTMDPADIIEQVADARFAATFIRQFPMASRQTAAVGYSWGGLAATILAMQDSMADFPLRAVVSLDGNDRYYYGGDAAEDAQFTGIRQSAYFRPGAFTAPHLYLGSGRESFDFPVDSVFVLAKATRAAAIRYLRLPGTGHEDFSGLPFLAGQPGPPGKAARVYPAVGTLVAGWLDAFVRGKDAFAATLQALQRQDPSLLTTAEPVTGRLGALPALVLEGKVCSADGKGLPYVNLGVPGRNQGTVSRPDGSFRLVLKEVRTDDTVRVSLVGYQTLDLTLAQVIKGAAPGGLRLTLAEQTQALPEVVVRTDASVVKVLGNPTESRFFSGGFGPNQLGGQIGIPVRARKKPMQVEKVDFHVSYNAYDSLTLRLNVYQLKNGVPGPNLLRENVLLRLGKQTGRFAFDLSGQDIVIREDVLVALELLDGQGTETRFFLSAGVFNGATYYRRASQGTWRKAKGMGVGIQVTVRY